MYNEAFLHQKQYSWILRQEPLATRLEHLQKLEEMIRNNSGEILRALQADLGKPEPETWLTEIYPLLGEIREAKKKLHIWSRPTPVKNPAAMIGSKSFILREPRGVCLIFSPWNYPFNLALAPVIGAIAAGNCVFLKPSEQSPHVSRLLRRLFKEHFPENHILVYEGGPDVAQALLELPFDHIFFTGSTKVGKEVMAAAAKNLSSVTLELGGKSPTIVDESADLQEAAAAIVWGKFINCGQTCVAPDYVLVHKSVYEDFKQRLVQQVKKSYGENPSAAANLARIVSKKHTSRLAGLLQEAQEKNAQVLCGGEFSVEDRYFAPTLVENVDAHTGLLQEEIFGPILPLIPYEKLEEVIHFIQERPKPLTIYLFSQSKWNQKEIRDRTSSGGLCINSTLVHLAHPNLPFGGVGESGVGNYHGYFSYRAFSHEKSVFKPSRLMAFFLRKIRPPYSDEKVALLHRLNRWNI